MCSDRRGAGNRRRCSWVFEAPLMVLRESRAGGRRRSLRAIRSGARWLGYWARGGWLLRVSMVKLMPDFIIPSGILLVKSHDIDHGLWMLLLFLLRDTTLLEQPLPFFRQTSKLAGLVIVADMCGMDGIFRCRNLDTARRN